jgi:hypothetical protein
MKKQIYIACLAGFGLLASATLAGAQQKTAKACVEEWRADKANMQAKGITEKAYVANCRSGAVAMPSVAAPAPAQVAPPVTTTSTQPPVASPVPTSRTRPAESSHSSAASPTAAGQFATEQEARNRCPSDTVVWVNLKSKIYHFAGSRTYGNTKNGAFMCERETQAAGARAAKNETHP